jgi:hypothetical protein
MPRSSSPSRTARLDPEAVAGESDDEAARRGPERGAYPVHLHPLRELLRRALDDERHASGHGRAEPRIEASRA